jgi:hypothetical protein
MKRNHESDWTASLALAAAGRRYRIRRVLLANLRAECHQLGLDEGDEVTCLSNAQRVIGLEGRGGRQLELERESAWFVRVEAA